MTFEDACFRLSKRSVDRKLTLGQRGAGWVAIIDKRSAFGETPSAAIFLLEAESRPDSMPIRSY